MIFRLFGTVALAMAIGAGCGGDKGKDGDMTAAMDLTATVADLAGADLASSSQGDMAMSMGADMATSAGADMAMSMGADMAMSLGADMASTDMAKVVDLLVADLVVQFGDMAGGLSCGAVAGCYGQKCNAMPCQVCDAQAKTPDYAKHASAAAVCGTNAIAGPCAAACAQGGMQCQACITGACDMAGTCKGGVCSAEVTICNMDR